MGKNVQSFNEHSKNVSDVSDSEKNKYKKTLIAIDNKEEGYKYYVGYIKTSEDIKSWVQDGVFKGFNTHEDVLSFIDELKGRGIKSINIFSPKEYSNIERIRKQGY